VCGGWNCKDRRHLEVEPVVEIANDLGAEFKPERMWRYAAAIFINQESLAGYMGRIAGPHHRHHHPRWPRNDHTLVSAVLNMKEDKYVRPTYSRCAGD
jgi:hypothetical protein